MTCSLPISMLKFLCVYYYACYLSVKQTGILLHICEDLTTDKNLHAFQHLKGSEICQALCLEDCLSVLKTISLPFQLKIKGAMYIGWQKPSFNKQLDHVNLSLSFGLFFVSFTFLSLLFVFSTIVISCSF